jgi:hypothetical protein
MACSGNEGDVATLPPPASSAVPADLLAQTWQVRLAVDAARAPFEGRAGWIAWFGGKRGEALQNFHGDGDSVAMARAHADYAAIYRQAAVLAANATVQVYGVDAQPTDPAEVSYLLGVSGAILGDQTNRARLGASSGSKVAGIAAADKAWKTWADAGATWPPDGPLATAPGAPGTVEPGTAPDAGPMPSYQLPEVGETLLVDAGDPGSLLALARWHEAAALAASPDNAAAIQVLLDPWRLPTEPHAPAAAPVAIPDTFLFMSASTSAGDAMFLSDLERDGVPAVAAHVKDSAYAAIVDHCTTDGHLSVDCMLDESAAFGQAIEKAMAGAAGKEDGFHRAFADYARVGVLRAGDRVAWKMDDREAGGRLRINALDRTVGSALDPLFLVSVAAWDAGNRNSVRAEEIVHGLLTEVPGLEAARLPLDALHIRLSRNAAPGRPMH